LLSHNTHQSSDPESLVLLEFREMTGGRAAVLTLNRPEQRNPLDKATIAALNRHLDELLSEPAMRAVIITGAGPAFSAGGDLRGYVDLYQDAEGFRAFLDAIRHLFDRLESSRLLSIAAVNGACVAGGFEMALSCDLIVAGRRARIGDGHLKFWQLPGGGGSQRLPRAVGSALAKRLFYTHELLSGEAALSAGIASALYDDDALLEGALALAERATETPEHTIVTMKHLLAVAESETLSAGLGKEIDVLVDYTTLDDGPALRGLQRFLNG
jgi:enoyl-CoA hydratase/carnithine racemase